MSEKIIEENIVKQTNEDLTAYAVYVARKRMLPACEDGLKPVQRKIIFALYNDFPQTAKGKTVKTASVTGKVIEKYHPHGDTSVAMAIKPMANWFESYVPLINPQGSFGNIWGDGPAAPRYTEVALSKYAVDCVIGDMKETYASTDWEDNYDGNYKEPMFLPASIPNLLINGTFGIAVGLKTEIPKFNINEVIDATLHLIDHPNSDVILIPDDPQGSDIIDTDWVTMSKTGKGKFKTRAKIEIGEFHHRPALFINTLPSMVFFESIRDKIEKLKEANQLPQVVDILNNSKIPDLKSKNPEQVFQVIISLKKGADPNFVKQVLYATTSLEKTTSLNFEVLYKNMPVSWNYKQYLLNFINFRRERKGRLFSNKLKECRTRMDVLDLYIRVIESGKIDEIVKKIRKQKSSDESELIEFIMKTVKGVKPNQAKFLLNTNIKRLSLGYLNSYRAEHQQLQEDINRYYDYCLHVEKIDNIIKQELIDAKKKYGCPRRSRIISINEAENIPEGTFKVVLTEKGFIKKMDMNDRSTIKNDKIDFSIVVDNKDSILLFSRLAKVYKLPVHKIPFSKPGSNGLDLRMVVKKYVGEGISTLIPESGIQNIKSIFEKDGIECDIFVLTKDGLFKRMDISEVMNVTVSGLMYAKLNEGDYITDIILMNPMNELIIYSKNKVLRMSGMEAPLLNRSTKGNVAMRSKYPIDGFTCITPDSKYVVAITNSGRVNKVPLNIIPLSSRGKSGNSVIKLGKNDGIYTILVCKNNDSFNIITNRGSKIININELKDSSSISAGDKLIDSSGIVSIIPVTE